jgi:hypothetical protein
MARFGGLFHLFDRFSGAAENRYFGYLPPFERPPQRTRPAGTRRSSLTLSKASASQAGTDRLWLLHAGDAAKRSMRTKRTLPASIPIASAAREF